MTEDEALFKYCERFDLTDLNLSLKETEEFFTSVRKSVGFQWYQLSVAIQEFKTEIINALPKWLRVFLRGKG